MRHSLLLVNMIMGNYDLSQSLSPSSLLVVFCPRKLYSSSKLGIAPTGLRLAWWRLDALLGSVKGCTILIYRYIVSFEDS